MATATVKTKIINGNRWTRNETVLQNVMLVRKIAARYEFKARAVGLDYGDLVSLGMIGLIKAFDDFDDSLGYRFSTYAVPKIRGEITKGILKSNVGVHYPAHVRRDADFIQLHKLEEYSPEDIAKVLKVKVPRVKHALDFLSRSMPASLDMNVSGSDEGERSTLGDLLGKEHDFSRIIVEEFFQTLTQKEKKIARLRIEKRSNAEIGRMFGVSRTAIAFHLERIRIKWALYQKELPIK